MLRPANIEQFVHFLKEQIALVTKTNLDSIDEHVNFIKCGISSMQVIMLINKIKKLLDIEISPVAMFEHKNIYEFATYLNHCVNE